MQSFLLSAWLFLGAIAPFTERGVTDFDTFLDLLNPYGTWVETAPGQLFIYKPFSNSDWIPFTEGRWVYSDFGWFWQGTEPHQWATSHYGYWRRNAQGEWGWIPGTEWQANPVDWRGTKTHIGWRSSNLNKMGEFTESDEKRVAHPEEWAFVKKEDFGKPLTRSLIITGADAQPILIDSYPLSHEIELYRVIPRAGPDPLDFPATQAPLRKDVVIVKGSDKVSYYTKMSLPTFWTPLPPDARPDQIYLYQPKFHQDNDGIQRRIKIWSNPKARLEAISKVNQALNVSEEIKSTNTPTATPPKTEKPKPPEPKEKTPPPKPTYRSR